ncbi:hypothetical protein H257_02444 [Aphanomyces astaci]|uniref:Peptidase M13 C-terminal domain-containing protein n=1 Tax=Aphanomyces astaci TaxID=112090 RepID=W4H3S0_APHAT|nr:hypothetical protein H257_02444 [Aphanomyces astaci]ETV85914.1 hypothetical protein H257_02444 [Aphanomyces astaci]|eukprot:XP_009824386.1 hypothetical protein H257_02444 [Aphanomyces astaci]
MEAVVFTYTAFTYYELDQKYPLLIDTWLKANGFNVHKQCSTDWNTTLDDLRTIVEYKLIHASSNHLTPEFRTANWNFFGKIIDGEKVKPTREQFCIAEVDKTVGELLGQYYLDEVWSAETAKAVDELVKALESSTSTGIATTDWLDDSTRANEAVQNPQLYPTLTLDSKSYFNNLWKVSQVNIDTNLKLAGQPVDKRKFDVPPQTFDAAQNFGATGVHIGHEITHGFDNIGRNYDGDGKLNPRWSNATDTTTFKQKAQCFSDQNDKFVVKSEVTGDVWGNVNGELSLVETIADNGGLKTSFREYLKKFPSQYTENAGDKLFYLLFAQARCSKNTDARLNTHLTDPHPPDRFRVTGGCKTTLSLPVCSNAPPTRT